VRECTLGLKHEDDKFMERQRVWKDPKSLQAELECTAAEIKGSIQYCEIIARGTFAGNSLVITTTALSAIVSFLNILSPKYIKNTICLIFFGVPRICIRLDET